MYVLVALLLLSLLIVVHEGGHYMAARLCGIEVREFSLGMGPLLLKRINRNGTQFSLRPIPIGGYCAFYGEDEETDDPRGFNHQPVWKRAVTVASGPLMNFVLAIVAVVLYLSLVGVPAAVNRVDTVEPPARSAGLLPGDEIMSVNGKSLSEVIEISQAISESDGQTVRITVRRGGENVDLTLTPFFDQELSRWRVGFTFGQGRERIPLLRSIPFSFQYNAENATLIVRTLRNLVTRGEGINDVSGPVGTVAVISEVTQQAGFDILFDLAAVISINLGIMNLLPIPGLDGSRLLFLLVEAIRRRPVRRELEGAIHMAGLVLLLMLSVALTYKDILRILHP